MKLLKFCFIFLCFGIGLGITAGYFLYSPPPKTDTPPPVDLGWDAIRWDSIGTRNDSLIVYFPINLILADDTLYYRTPDTTIAYARVREQPEVTYGERIDSIFTAFPQ